jgi:hypothetical protein
MDKHNPVVRVFRFDVALKLVKEVNNCLIIAIINPYKKTARAGSDHYVGKGGKPLPTGPGRIV